MINGGDVIVSIVAGLALPLAMLDGYRALAGSTLQWSVATAQHCIVALLLAILLGPGLFVERMLASWRSGALSAADSVNALVIALGWAGLYGYVILRLVEPG